MNVPDLMHVGVIQPLKKTYTYEKNCFDFFVCCAGICL